MLPRGGCFPVTKTSFECTLAIHLGGEELKEREGVVTSASSISNYSISASLGWSLWEERLDELEKEAELIFVCSPPAAPRNLKRRGWMETCFRLLSSSRSCSQPCCHLPPVCWSRTTFYMITRWKRFTVPIMRAWCATWRERSAATDRSGPPESDAGWGARTSIR